MKTTTRSNFFITLQQKLQLHMKSKHSDNSPVKIKGKEIKPRKKRRDAGTMVRSTAAKLAGISMTLDMEKQIVKESEENFMNDVAMSNINDTTDALMDNISDTTEGTKEVTNETTVVAEDSISGVLE